MNRLPSLFVSHGAPTFALEPGRAGALLRELGPLLPRPRAVLVVSPHWGSYQPLVGTSAQPATVHDFGGFPAPLYRLQYPAPGHPALAQRTVDLLRAAGWDARAHPERGLDHGAWVPLMHLYPEADLPVFQVSLPVSLDGPGAYAYGQALAPLRDEGVLIVGSGSLTHNLYEFRQAGVPQAAYAREFSQWVREAVLAGDTQRLIDTLALAPHAERAHPTTEHFLPLLVALGAAGGSLPATVLDGGIEHGVLSMESYVFGATVALPQAEEALSA